MCRTGQQLLAVSFYVESIGLSRVWFGLPNSLRVETPFSSAPPGDGQVLPSRARSLIAQETCRASVALFASLAIMATTLERTWLRRAVMGVLSVISRTEQIRLGNV